MKALPLAWFVWMTLLLTLVAAYLELVMVCAGIRSLAGHGVLPLGVVFVVVVFDGRGDADGRGHRGRGEVSKEAVG